jgi:hypothetical protein
MLRGGAVAGAVAGATLGLIFLLVPGPKVITVQPQFPGAIVLLPAIVLALIGAISGGAFGVLLMLVERGGSVEHLRVHRVATYAAIATAPALRLGGWSWTAVGLGSLVSAAIGAVATRIAKRGAARPAARQVDAPEQAGT